MVGGGNRRDEGSVTRNNTNVFAALDSLRRKKKNSDKEKGTSKVAGKSKSKEAAEEKPQVFWAPAPLTVKSWADVDDEDDDDYYATTAPPPALWATSGLNKTERSVEPLVEESESDDELLDDCEDDMEEDHDEEVIEQTEPIIKKHFEVPPAPKVEERQISRKERRKKELAELDAILADFVVNSNEKASGENLTKETKEEELNGDAEKKDTGHVESKIAKKKKKKKDKVLQEAKEAQDSPKSSDVPGEHVKVVEAEEGEKDTSVVDVKDRLKKVLSTKKKKSNKEMDAAARAASMEAAARSAKLAAAKKKEKSHYNQQPTR